jgi:hypothetical protein
VLFSESETFAEAATGRPEEMTGAGVDLC